MRLESKYQGDLIKKVRKLIPEALVFKGPSQYLQGIPDIVILAPGFWATLEVKRSANEPEQPNQRYYVEKMHEMSFSAFIYPENEAEVLHELQLAYRNKRQTCNP